MLKQPNNSNKLCARRLFGCICITCGIIAIFGRYLWYMCTGDVLPFEGRGTMLVQTGAVLLGVTSADAFAVALAKNKADK